jgi:transposase
MQGREKAQKSMFGSGPMEDKIPRDHPLRKIRADFDAAFSQLAGAFESSYGQVGNVSYPPAVLLRAHLLRALYSIRSERALCEQIDMNAGFRWFVGLDWDDKVFDHSTLSFNRERLFGSGAAQALLGEVVRLATSRKLLQSDRLVVDGTLIKAWASHKSFKAQDDPPEGGGFHGKKRSNTTHSSSSDPDARLIRKGYGKESMLCHLGSVLVDSAHGLVRACKATRACGLGGDAEVLAALDLAQEHLERRQMLVGDRGYDQKAFVQGLRSMGIRAHPRARYSGSALDGRTTKTKDYAASLKKRYLPEPVFGWIKGPGRMAQTKLRGTQKVDWELHLYCIAFNLRRMATLA